MPKASITLNNTVPETKLQESPNAFLPIFPEPNVIKKHDSSSQLNKPFSNTSKRKNQAPTSKNKNKKVKGRALQRASLKVSQTVSPTIQV